MVGWFEDMEVTSRLGAGRSVPSPEMEREWLKRMAEDRNSMLWAIEREAQLIGTTGIHAIDWANQNGTTGTLIGDKTAWGKGIAGELMRLRADFAFTELPLRKLKSGYVEGNEASRRAQEGGRLPGGGAPSRRDLSRRPLAGPDPDRAAERRLGTSSVERLNRPAIQRFAARLSG